MIRHSLLPKLAQCPCFESAGGSSPAASRGTMMDEAFREMFQANSKPFKKLNSVDADAVMWAVETTKQIAGGHEVITDEESLKVKTPGIDHIGTEDCRIPAIHTSLDLKSGISRSYYEQQCAYAYGNMAASYDFDTGEYAIRKWTTHLLFCDQERVVTHSWTIDEAKEIVEGVIAAYNDPDKSPTACDYCNWCKNSTTCEQITIPVTNTLEVVESDIQTNLAQIKEQLAADTNQLALFVKQSSIFKTHLVDWAKKLLKEKLQAGEKIAGWKLQRQKGEETFPAEIIEHIAESTKMSLSDSIKLFGGSISATKLQEYCNQVGYDISTITPDVGSEIVKLVEDKPRKVKL
jgi:hypothetical protein